MRRRISFRSTAEDIRSGLSEAELMAKHRLSPKGLNKVFRKLVDAGAIDEMELFMRTSLSGSTITKAFAVTQCPVQESDELDEITPPRDLETPSEITIREELSTTSTVFRRIFSKLTGTESCACRR